MGWPDNCLYWQAISSLIAVQYHCQPLIMAAAALSDTPTPQWYVRACTCALVCTCLFTDSAYLFSPRSKMGLSKKKQRGPISFFNPPHLLPHA